MLNVLHAIISTAIAFTVVVFVHEGGHFLVARWCNVQVTRFSIGFGKALWRFKGKTEYVLAAIPLGGYVKMLNTQEEKVPPSLLPYAFDKKPLYQKSCIVLAGPVANILFTICMYTLIPMIGIQGLAPIVETVAPQSAAFVAGIKSTDEIIRVGEQEVHLWSVVALELSQHLGEKVSVGLKSGKNVELDLTPFTLSEFSDNFFTTLGIEVHQPKLPTVIGEVVQESAAEQAGLQKGDTITSLNGIAVTDWAQLVNIVRENPGKILPVSVLRNAQTLNLLITPHSVKSGDKEIGKIGVMLAENALPAHLLRTQRYNLWQSVQMGVQRTYLQTVLIGQSIVNMINGSVSAKQLSGPIGIAEGASSSAKSGLIQYLAFLGILSLSLGIFNLLPIPLLDGGHLLVYAIEKVRGKPLSEKALINISKFGVIFLVAVMSLAFYNDIYRLIM